MDNPVETLISSLMSSSSSSSSESDDSDWEVLQYILFPSDEEILRVEKFIENVIHNNSDEWFKKNLRTTRYVAYNLIQRYASSEHFKVKISGGKKEHSAETQMLAFLWFAGNKNTYREVANLFGIGITSMHRYLNRVLDFFFGISREHIKFPKTEAMKEELAKEFQCISGFPNVIGYIDGTYIEIRKPAHKIRSTYINRHDKLSLTMQGICDAKKRFLDVCIGSPSRIHDARIFELSPIKDELPNNCGNTYHILGDSAYPLREYLLTPLRDHGQLNEQQKRFNLKFSQTRVKIENAFGLLKQRFRQLIRLEFLKVKTMCQFVLACCVLHNLCIDGDDAWEEDTDEILTNEEETMNGSPDNQTNEDERGGLLRKLGEIKRNRLVRTFSKEYISKLFV